MADAGSDTGSADGPTGEIRVRTEGGLAHFPGLAKERVVPFDQLQPGDRSEIASLADQADFFACTVPDRTSHPDARTVSLCLTIDGKSREMKLSEPVHDPALASLLSKVRQVSKP